MNQYDNINIKIQHTNGDLSPKSFIDQEFLKVSFHAFRKETEAHFRNIFTDQLDQIDLVTSDFQDFKLETFNRLATLEERVAELMNVTSQDDMSYFKGNNCLLKKYSKDL